MSSYNKTFSELELAKAKLPKDQSTQFDTLCSFYKILRLVPKKSEVDFYRSLIKLASGSAFFISGSNSQKEILLEEMNKLSEKSLESLKVFTSGSVVDKRTWVFDKNAQKDVGPNKDRRQFIYYSKSMGMFVPQRSWDNFLVQLLDVEDQSVQKILDLSGKDFNKYNQLISHFLDNKHSSGDDGLLMIAERNLSKCTQIYRDISSSSPLTPSPCVCFINTNPKYFPFLKFNDISNNNNNNNTSSSNNDTNNEHVNTDNDKKDESQDTYLLFDRVMCCVSCSNDGILMDADYLSSWNWSLPLDKHGILCETLNAGLGVLNVGGQLVYAVYSLNPVECEAVISTVLLQQKGTVELLDVSSKMGDIVYEKGLKSWKIMAQRRKWYEKPDEVPHRMWKQIWTSMFPPTDEQVIQEQCLHRCIRILPHKQDSCGMFMAVLKRVESFELVFQRQEAESLQLNVEENDNETKKRKFDDVDVGADDDDVNGKTRKDSVDDAGNPGNEHCDDEYVDLDVSMKSNDDDCEGDGADKEKQQHKKKLDEHNDDDDDHPHDDEQHGEHQEHNEQYGEQHNQHGERCYGLRREVAEKKSNKIVFAKLDDIFIQSIKEFYGLIDFKLENVVWIRDNMEDCTPRNLFYVNDCLKRVIRNNRDYLFARIGMKIFTYRVKDDVACKYIISQEGLPLVYKHMSKRIIHCSKKDFVVFASSARLLTYDLTSNIQNKLTKFENGCFIVAYTPNSDLNSTDSTEHSSPVVDVVSEKDDGVYLLICLKTEYTHIILTSEYLRKFYLQRLCVPLDNIDAFQPSTSCKKALANFATYVTQLGL